LLEEVELAEEEVDEEEREAGVVVADGLLLILMMPVKLKFFVNKSMMESIQLKVGKIFAPFLHVMVE